MLKEVTLPALAENVESATVLNVLVSVGDQVEVEQSLVELETDKATVELPAPCAGSVAVIHVREGDEIAVGAVILELDAVSEVAQSATDTDLGSVSEEAAEISSPATVEEEIAAPAEAAAPEPPPAPSPPPARVARDVALSPAPAPVGARRERTTSSPAPAAPSTRRLARELGVDLTQVEGTGLGGRITREDLTRSARARIEKGGESSGPRIPPLPDFSHWGAVERETMSGIRRKTAERMATAWSMIPHVSHFDRSDVTELERARKEWAPRVEEAGGKLTVTAIAIKVVASALKLFPRFNASLDIPHGEIVYKKYINVGVAVDTPRGLIVPVLRNVDTLNITEIATQLTAISSKARAGKIGLEDLSGGTFTVSNLGGLGTHHFTPIVNWPDVAILGLGRSTQDAVWIDGAFAPRLILPVSLSYDHRLIDGADAARFLRWICEALEDPFLLALEG